jgi:hypothetical protein
MNLRFWYFLSGILLVLYFLRQLFSGGGIAVVSILGGFLYLITAFKVFRHNRYLDISLFFCGLKILSHLLFYGYLFLLFPFLPSLFKSSAFGILYYSVLSRLFTDGKLFVFFDFLRYANMIIDFTLFVFLAAGLIVVFKEKNIKKQPV